MVGRQPGDDIGQWLDHHGHPMGVGVQHMGGVGHDPDMAGEEDQVAALQRRARLDRRANALALQVGVAWHGDAAFAQRNLHQPRTVDAAMATAADRVGTRTGTENVIAMIDRALGAGR